MDHVMLATDVVLQAIIGNPNGSVGKLMKQAKSDEIRLAIPHLALYCAVYSIRKGDQINAPRLAELLKYSEILPETPEYLGPIERESWVPNAQAVENWRKLALKDD